MKRIALIASAVAGLAFAAAPFAASAQAPQASTVAQGSTVSQGDASVGAQNIQRCQGCHGIPGWRTAYPEVYNVPKIAGQHSTYFVSALKAYRTGDRKHAGMRAIAISLSDKDINDLAAYYAEAK